MFAVLLVVVLVVVPVAGGSRPSPFKAPSSTLSASPTGALHRPRSSGDGREGSRGTSFAAREARDARDDAWDDGDGREEEARGNGDEEEEEGGCEVKIEVKVEVEAEVEGWEGFTVAAASLMASSWHEACSLPTMST